MKNNKKKTRMTKIEKRRLAFEKRNVKKEQNLARYGAEGGSALFMAKTSDVNRRIIAAVLALVFAISCIIVGLNLVTKANDTQANMKPAGTIGKKDDASGVVVNKQLEPNGDGKYDLKIEAYSTKEMEPITEKIPTDFIVVADQSGSMSTADMPTDYEKVTDTTYLETIATSNKGYYYKDGDNYYRVYPVKGYLYEYFPANSKWVYNVLSEAGADLSWFQGEEEASFNYANQYYYDYNGTYCPVTVTITGKVGTYYIKFKYKKPGATDYTDFIRPDNPIYKNILGGQNSTYKKGDFGYDVINDVLTAVYRDPTGYTYSEVKVFPFNGRIFDPINTGMYINYDLYKRHVGYTKLCYRDSQGVEHVLPSDNTAPWKYCNSAGQALNDKTGSRPQYNNLYTEKGNNQTRLDALKAALNQFAKAVADETDSFGSVDNKISIVGFSSDESTYRNTELLTGEELTIASGETNGIRKPTADAAPETYYAKALVSSTNGSPGVVNPKITSGIAALTARGGTQPEDGLEMAYKVLANRTNKQYTIRSGANKGTSVERNTIVIFFTDGHPGDYDYSEMYSEANDVVDAAYNIKHTNSKIFSIGVFGESDGNPLTYPKHEVTGSNRNGDWEYDLGWMETYYDTYYPNHYYYLNRNWLSSDAQQYGDNPNDTIYDYMSVVSSNYPDAQKYMNVYSSTVDNEQGPFAGEANYSEYSSYIDMVNAVRSSTTAEKQNNYYRMASNQATLVEAFLQAVTMNNHEAISPAADLTGNAVLQDVLSSDFMVSIPAGQSKPVITCKTVKCKMDANKNVTEDTGEDAWDDITSQLGDSNIRYDEATKSITIRGFSYTDNYIANPKPADSEHGLEENQGKKLVVTIKNVLPTSKVTSKDGVIYSNDGPSSGLYVPNEDDAQTLQKLIELPRPSISRHSYTLEVTGDDKTTATFNVAPSLVNGLNDISNVILAYPNESGGLTRIKYTDYLNASDKYFDMKDGQSFYFENVPADYRIETSIIATDTANTYTWTDLNPEVDLSMGNPTSNSANPNTYSDSFLHITSVANVRTVTIKEAVDNSAFANQGDKFVPTVYIEAPTGVNVDDTATFGETEWRKDGENRMVLKDPLTPIKADEQESITLTLPSGWKLFVDQTDDKDYSVKSATYKVDSTEATSDYAEGGWNWSITKDATITITNTRPSIPVEGINNSSNHNWIIYLLVGIAAIAVIAGGIFLWKKKDEFVEQ